MSKIPKQLVLDAQELCDPQKELGEPIVVIDGKSGTDREYVERLIERLAEIENDPDHVRAQRAACIGVELYFFLYDEDSND